jgi:hypothetical protein
MVPLSISNFLTMNIKINNHSTGLFRSLIRSFFQKLTQSPDFYNIKYYTKVKMKGRDQQGNW